MTLTLLAGEKIPIKGRTVTVTPKAIECLPRVRDHLIELAQRHETITYGDLVSTLQLPYIPTGLGRLLDLLSVDCERRGEPSLASIVVGSTTGEVGHDFAGDPVGGRAQVYQHWA